MEQESVLEFPYSMTLPMERLQELQLRKFITDILLGIPKGPGFHPFPLRSGRIRPQDIR